MKKKTYSEKLQHPKWQRKRLHILNRDNFACTLCLDKENTLHVHHMRYDFGKEPWEYEDDVFKTVCQDCHLIYEDFKGTEFQLLKAFTIRTVNAMKITVVHVFIDDDEEPMEFLYFFSINRDTRECEVSYRIDVDELNHINRMMSMRRNDNVG